jgi:ubiquinone/menaquinone biosynthesis C-methylase UbiE
LTLKKHWDTIYTNRQPEETSWYQPTPIFSLELLAAAGVNAGSRVIDVGGGASRLVDELLDQGLSDITVADVSEVALLRSQSRLDQAASDVNWLVGDVLEMPLGGPFDVWHDRAVCHFLTESVDRDQYVEQLTNSLAPNGHVVIAAFAHDGPEYCSGLPVVRYTPEQMQSELGESFQLIETRRDNHMTPDGREQRFLYCLFQITA